jgi:hypothetical protein
MGLQVYGVFVILFGFIIAAIGQAVLGRDAGFQPNLARHDEFNRPIDNPPIGNPPFNNPAVNNLPIDNNPPPPIKLPAQALTGDPALDQILADLGDKDRRTFQSATKALADIKPNQHQAVVAKKLAEVVLTTPVYNRTPLLQVLQKWATPNELPALLHLLGENDINTRNETLQVLGKLRDERSVGPVVRCFAEFPTRYHGEQALLAKRCWP